MLNLVGLQPFLSHLQSTPALPPPPFIPHSHFSSDLLNGEGFGGARAEPSRGRRDNSQVRATAALERPREAEAALAEGPGGEVKAQDSPSASPALAQISLTTQLQGSQIQGFPKEFPALSR